MRMTFALAVVAAGCGGGSGSAGVDAGDDGGGVPDFAFDAVVPIDIRGHGLAAADVDGDGIDDLAVAILKTSADAPSLVIFHGRGDRGFVSGAGHPMTVGPERVVLADVTGDQILDVVSGAQIGSSITVLLGEAGGTFGPERVSPVNARTSTLVVGAFDADMVLDVVTEHRTQSSVIQFVPGDGAGTFGPATDIPIGIRLSSIVAADLDEDGALDLVVSDVFTDQVVIFRGDGDGSFAERSRVTIRNANELAVGDLDRDGHVDVVVFAAGRLWVALGNGDGTLQEPLEHRVGTATSPHRRSPTSTAMACSTR
jgi:hypothetical protein